MKKILVLVISLVCMNLISAQTEKGKFVVSGATGLQFASMKTEHSSNMFSGIKVTTNTFSIMPSFGYYIIDNLAVGVLANYASTTIKNDGFKDTSSSLALMPFGSYYFPVEGNFRPAVQFGAGLASTAYGSNDENKFSGFVVNFGGGASYFLNDKIAVDFGLSYTSGTLKNKENSDYEIDQNNLAGSIGLSLFF